MRIEPTALLKQKLDSYVVENDQKSFAKIFTDAVNDVNKLQHKADEAALSLALGEADDIHNIMIQAEQAHLALQLTIAVRNKIVEAYQEISRMQI